MAAGRSYVHEINLSRHNTFSTTPWTCGEITIQCVHVWTGLFILKMTGKCEILYWSISISMWRRRLFSIRLNMIYNIFRHHPPQVWKLPYNVCLYGRVCTYFKWERNVDFLMKYHHFYVKTYFVLYWSKTSTLFNGNVISYSIFLKVFICNRIALQHSHDTRTFFRMRRCHCWSKVFLSWTGTIANCTP